jgi:hypothetical protein
VPSEARMAQGTPPRALASAVAVVVICLLLLPLPGNGSGPARVAPSTPIAVAPAVSTYAVNGTVYGMPGSLPSSVPIPIVGDIVRAVPASGCPITEYVALPCSPTASALSASDGAYTLMLPVGSWLVYSLPSAGFGGDSQNVSVTPLGLSGVNLFAYLELSYTNSTYVLPGFTPLTPYVNNSDYNTQVPVVSYTADGVFYIDASDELVFYSFATATLQSIAPWTPLYENVANYAGDLENAFFLTLDGTYAYELGCSAKCTRTSSLEVRAVNVTTGQTFVWNVEGIADGITDNNVQVDLIGLDGNDSTAALILQTGAVLGYGLWNGTQFNLGHVPFFEANNAYWVPFLDAFVSVEAGGSSSDNLEEAELEPDGSGLTLVTVYSGEITTANIKSAFVDGVVFNLTLNEVAFAFGSYAKNTLVVATYTFADRVLQQRVGLRISAYAYGDPLADEHRLSITTGAPLAASDYDPYFYNQSWAVNPFSSQYFDTNQPEGITSACGAGHAGGCENNFTGQNYAAGPVASTLFLNASYGITPYSVDCAPSGVCPLLGSTAGSSLGTVFWLAPEGRPALPYPLSTPLDQPYAPSAPVLAQQNTSTSVTVTWGASADYPILNYTLFWRPASEPHWTSSVNLSSSTTSYTISSVPTGTTVCYGVEASDLHGESALAGGCAAAGGRGTLAPPTDLSATSIGPINATLAWSLPLGVALTSLTLVVGFACGHWEQSIALPPTTTTYNLTGLTPSTEYCAAVEDQIANGSNALSTSISFSTSSPGGPPASPEDLHLLGRGAEWFHVGWTNPSGLLTSDEAFLAPYSSGVGCGYPVLVSASSSGPFAAWNYTGLTSNRTYCASVVAVGLGGSSASSPALYLLAAEPGDLTVENVTSSSVTLGWANIPAATLSNVTIYLGPADCVFDERLSVGATDEFDLSGLRASSTYCFSVVDWVHAGSTYPSDLATPFGNATTLPAGPCGPNCSSLSFSSDSGLIAVTSLALAAAILAAVAVGSRGKPRTPSRPP